MRSADSTPKSEIRNPKSSPLPSTADGLRPPADGLRPTAAWLWPAAAAGLPLAVYLATSARHVLDGDAAVLATQAYRLGLAHPPGYALMGLLGKLVTTAVFFGPLAWRANLVAALAAGATLALGYALLRRWGAARPVAVVAMWLLAFSPLFWSQALYINAYMVATMVTFGIVLLLDMWAARESLAVGRKPSAVGPPHTASGLRPTAYGLLAAAGFMCGLGLSAHPSMALAFPAVALFVLFHLRRDGSLLRCAAVGLAGAAAGCAIWVGYTLCYLSHATSFWAYLAAEGQGSDWRDFFRVVASRDYPARLALHVARSLAELSPLGAALAVVGVIALARRRRGLLLLVGLIYLAQANFAVTMRHWHHFDVYRLPCVALQALAAGVGLALLCERIRAAGARALALVGAAALTLSPPYTALLVANEYAQGLTRHLRPKSPWRAEFARLGHSDGLAALAWAKPGGTIVANYGPYATLLYLQRVEAANPAVQLVAGFGAAGAALGSIRDSTVPNARLYAYLRRTEEGQRESLAVAFDLRPVFTGALHVLYEIVPRRAGVPPDA